MIYQVQPEDFEPKMDVAACILLHKEKFLMLHRAQEKPQGGTWCLPGGKTEPGESLRQTIWRELLEETRLLVPKESFQYQQSYLIRHCGYDLRYHVFSHTLKEKLYIHIDPKENQNSNWVTLEEALKLPLMPDEEPCLKNFFSK